MKDNSFFDKIKSVLLYCGTGEKEFKQVQSQVAAANHKSLMYWTILVSAFWVYCIIMSFFVKDYEMCRISYIISLGTCAFSYLCSRFLVPRFPKSLTLFKFLFRLTLIGGGIGIAVCQPYLRTITLFAIAIISPSIFIDSTVSSIVVQLFIPQ